MKTNNKNRPKLAIILVISLLVSTFSCKSKTENQTNKSEPKIESKQVDVKTNNNIQISDSTNIETKNETRKRLELTVKGENITAEVRINDLKVCIITPDNSENRSPISFDLKDSINTLEIISSDRKGSIWARITEITSNEGALVFNFSDLKDEDQEGQILKLTVLNKKVSFTSSVKGNVDSEWKNNEILDNSDIEDATAFANRMYTAIQKGDFDNFLSLYDPLFINQSKRLPNTNVAHRTAELRNELKEDITSIIEDKDPIWQWDDFNDIQLNFVKVADGRLFQMQRKDGSPVIRTSGNDHWGRIEYSNTIGKKEGKWYVFRD